MRFRIALLFSVAIFAAQPAFSGSISSSSKPDPILTGGPAGPCDPQTQGADYVGGTDVNGNPVAPADLAGPPVPVPGHLDLPVKTQRGTAYVSADGKSLAPLLNPPPSCAPAH